MGTKELRSSVPKPIAFIERNERNECDWTVNAMFSVNAMLSVNAMNAAVFL
jgi:hypothetical protein